MSHECAIIFFDPSQNLVVAVSEVPPADFVKYRDSDRYSAEGSMPKVVLEAIATLGPQIKEFKVVTAR